MVSPIFQRGNIGRIGSFGTVNDISMCGAEPKYLSLSFIIEEGLQWKILKKIIHSIKLATEKKQVYKIVTGDTKVVERLEKGDKILHQHLGIVVLRQCKNRNRIYKPNQSIIINEGHQLLTEWRLWRKEKV